MVSRQETARPLLTPGEVMQLPPNEAVVMVSSVAPIKAKKLRYYADANFTPRVLAPPVLSVGRYTDVPPSRPDDWSDLAMPAVAAAPGLASMGDGEATDDAGPRRQPELADVAAHADEHATQTSDLALLDDDDPPLPMPARLDPHLQRSARLATLDPADGIPL
jgi:type IV secretion system protein VirD4